MLILKDSLIKLCEQHDEIKHCNLRLAGLDGNVLPPDAKKQYFKMLDELIDELLNYIDNYQHENHVRFGLRFGIVRGYIPRLYKDSLQKSFNEHEELIDFLAETDFTILTKIHMMIEYMYHLLTGEWYTRGFKERLIRG